MVEGGKNARLVGDEAPEMKPCKKFERPASGTGRPFNLTLI
jgi:hypothetical protein